jgi:hypothetical protein
MPIDYFANPCMTSSCNTCFGLCDDPAPAANPAYIDEHDDSRWIAEVTNNSNYQVEFYPIDHCIEIRRPNGEMESRCDGLMKCQNSLVFVELKERMGKGWIRDARKQLEKTIEIFKIHHNILAYNTVEAHICNRLKPAASVGYGQIRQKFLDDTGCNLTISREIIL